MFYVFVFLSMIDEQVENKCWGESRDVAHTRYHPLPTSRALLALTPEFALSHLFSPYNVFKHEHNLLNR